MNAVIKEHNIIEFYDGENIVYSVETPYMYDNEFNLSSDIEIILDKVDDGYILTIKPDEKWLNDKNRKYPVTIDPTVNTSQVRNQIDDLFIYEGDDNVDTYAKDNQHILRVGSNNFSGTGQHPTRSLIRFNLPNLNTGDQVIDAKLGIYSYACGLEGVRCPNGKPIEINAHKVLKSWNDDNARWNYLGSDDSYDHKVIDYQVFNYDENDQVKLYQFDITSIAKDWYLSGENNGLMLKENNEINGLNREDAYFFSSDISDKYSNGRPLVSITYRNQTGTENYQTFSSHSVSDFNVNVNNYNGNLVLQHEDVSTPGGRLPALIKHVYNTNDKDINIGYGNGFRLNLNQTITTDSDYLRYIDEDGTRHFFKKEGNNYKDEDGLNLMIYSDGNDYRMEDKGGNKSYFSKKDNTWYLYKIVDTNGNQMVIDLDSNNFNRINKVTDGASDCLTFVYSNDKLSKILDTAGREVKFNYSDNNLISIVNKNNDIEKINYNNNLITKLTSFDNSYNTYEYYEKSPYRLKKVSEYGSNGSLGSSLDFVYGENVTSITDNNGKKTNYVFNNLGQTTSITDLGNESSTSLAYGQSFEFDTSEGDSKNKIKSEGKIISYASNSIPNVVVNGDAEEDNYYWDFVGNGVSFDTSEKYQGLKSFKFSAGYMTQPVTVEPGKTYKLSAYIKSNSSNNGKAYMSFSHDDSMNLETFDKTFNVTNEWREYSFNFTVPNGVLGKNKLTISSSSDNIIYFDDIKIEDESSNLYNPNNLINNGNFDKGLDDWTVQHFPGIDDGIVENQGNKVLKIAGEINSVKAYNQIINKSGTKGSTLNVSFWALNTGVSIDNLREAKVQVELLDSNGAILQSENLNVSNDSSSWQFINKYIVAKSNFSKVKITPSFFKQKGYILFDNISYYIDNETGSFTYDSKGNVVSNKNAALEKNDYSYDSLNQQISLLNNRGRTTLYSYDYNHRNRLLSMRSPDGMDSEYTYDNFGNQTSVKTYSKRDISKENIDQSEIYYIKSYTNDLYVTANGSVENSGTKLNLSPLKDDGTNEWNIVRTTNGKYVVKAARSRNETVWDVDGGNAADGTLMQIYQGQGNEHNNQTYEIVENDDGTFTFKTKVSDYNKCVDVPGGGFVSGQKIWQYSCNNSIAQKFILVPKDKLSLGNSGEDSIGSEVKKVSKISSDKVYYIKSRTNNLFVSVIGSKNEDGKLLNLKPITDDGLAEWRFVKTSDNKFKIKANGSTNFAAMDVKDYQTSNYTPIQIWSDPSGEFDTRVFDMVFNGDGTVTFKTKLTNYGKCIDVSGGVFGNGSSIQQYDCNGTIAQKFVLYEKDTGDRKYTEVNTTYDEKGKYKTSTTDERGKVFNYSYDDSTGNLSNQTDAKGNITSYEYDALDRVTKITNSDSVSSYIYDKDKLKTINHNGFKYNFEYDEFGNSTVTKVNDKVLIKDVYEKQNGNLRNSEYGNGDSVSYSYDRFDRLSGKTVDGDIIRYSYDNFGNLDRVWGKNFVYTYKYDLSGRVTEKGQDDKFKANYSYDNYNNLNEINYNMGGKTNKLKYTYDIDNKLTLLNNIKFGYDELNRLSYKKIGGNYKIKYSYLDIDNNRTTSSIKKIQNGLNTIEYDYDDNGNISKVLENGKLVNEYEYDNLNQLTLEHDKKQNKTIIYTYDKGGNILNKKYYKYKTEELIDTVNYSYNDNWKDQLSNFNGVDITYDEIGNPLTYGDITYSWQNGRQLKEYKDGSQTISYKYNDDGIRISKKINDKEYKYYLDDDNIIYEETPNGIIYYIYNDDELIGFEYNNKTYYYEKNQQSDIIGLLNGEFNEIATYTYDSFGKILSVKDSDGKEITNKNNIALINPFRYRSYYYDSETSLYYLNSRYYNPEMGRFINADGIIGTQENENAYNLYAYTGNNPINLKDLDGDVAIAAGGIASIIKYILGGYALYVTAQFTAQIIVKAVSDAKTNGISDSKSKRSSAEKKHTVYVLKDSNDVITYVGRTTNWERRREQHKNSINRGHLELDFKFDNLTRWEARGLEQALIMKYETLNKDNKAANQINGIAWDNPKCRSYLSSIIGTYLDENEVYVGYCK